MCSRIFFLLNELGVMRQCPLPVLPLLLLFLLRPRRSLQIEPSASAVAFSDGEGGVADYPVYPGYGEEEDQHLQEEEEDEDPKSGERGSGLNVKDELLRPFGFMFLDSGEEPALFAGRSGGGGKWVKMSRKKKRRRKKTDSKRRRRRPKPRMGFRVGGGAMRERARAPFFPAPADDGPFRRRLPRRRRLPWSYRPRPWWWDPGGGKAYHPRRRFNAFHSFGGGDYAYNQFPRRPWRPELIRPPPQPTPRNSMPPKKSKMSPPKRWPHHQPPPPPPRPPPPPPPLPALPDLAAAAGLEEGDIPVILPPISLEGFGDVLPPRPPRPTFPRRPLLRNRFGVGQVDDEEEEGAADPAFRQMARMGQQPDPTLSPLLSFFLDVGGSPSEAGSDPPGLSGPDGSAWAQSGHPKPEPAGWAGDVMKEGSHSWSMGYEKTTGGGDIPPCWNTTTTTKCPTTTAATSHCPSAATTTETSDTTTATSTEMTTSSHHWCPTETTTTSSSTSTTRVHHGDCPTTTTTENTTMTETTTMETTTETATTTPDSTSETKETSESSSSSPESSSTAVSTTTTTSLIAFMP